MNTGKLYALAKDLADENEEKSVHLLAGLLSRLQDVIDNPVPEHQQMLSASLDSLRECLKDAPSNNFHDDWKNMLEEIGVAEYYGIALLKKVEKIFSENQITPATVLEKTQELQNRVTENKNNFNNIINSFEFFDIDLDILEDGECELSITIPKKIGGKMDKLGEEIDQLSKVILKPFVEITGESSDGFIVKGVSSSDPTIYVLLTCAVACSILSVIDKSLSVYKKLLEIKAIRLQAKKAEVGDAVIDAFDNDIKNKMTDLVNHAVSEYLAEFPEAQSDGSRGRSPEEINNQITSSVEKLIRRFDDGFAMSVRGKKYELDVDENGDERGNISKEQKQQNTLIDNMNKTTRKLTYQNKGEPQIPELLIHADTNDTNGS